MKNCLALAFISLLALGYSPYGQGAGSGHFPERSVRYVVPDSAGSGGDIIGRIVSAGMSETLGQQVFVDNRAGASSNLGADYVAKSSPDGYTLLAVSTTLSANVNLFKTLTYDLSKDFAAVTQLALTPHVLVVHPAQPVKTVAEFIRLAKAKPGSLNYSSPGSGTSAFIPAELFRRAANIDIVHIPYKGGGPALQAVLAGEVQAYFAPILTTLSHIRQGSLRAIALTSAQHLPLMPELTTLAESGFPEVDFSNSLGLVVPAKTPPEIIDILNRQATNSLKKPDTKKRINDLGGIIIGSSATDYSAFINKEITTLGELFKKANVKPD